MECREFLLRYSEYDDSLIPAHEADRFRSHMAECSACARYDRVLRKGRMVARQLPPPEAGADFIPRLRLRLLEARARRQVPGTRLATGLAAATVLMVTVAAVRFMDGAPPTPGQEVPSAAGAAVVRHAARTPGWTARDGWRRGRIVLLPPVTRPNAPRAWGDREVAPSPTESYSPLETGPPVYRGVRPSAAIANPDRRALD